MRLRNLGIFVGGVVLVFLLVVGLTVVWAHVTQATEEALFTALFVDGLFMFFGGLLVSYDWLGEKPDYSETAYVSRYRGFGGRVWPWARSKKTTSQDSVVAKSRVVEKDKMRVRYQAKSTVHMAGLVLLLVGLLLMVTAGILLS